MQHLGIHYCQDSSVPLKNSPKLANFCYQPGNTQPCDYGSNGWAGNIADGNDYLPPYWQFQTYSEADFNFSITCPNAGWHDGYAQWVGLGGVNDNNHLIQVGEEYTGTLGIGVADLIWENPADGSPPQDFNLNISCGDYMMGQVYAPNCMYAYDLNLHKGAGPICSGPAADEKMAEFITERLGFYTNNPTPLSDFGNLEFDSCGVTVNNVGYRGIGATLHDYTNIYNVWQTPGSGGHALATTGPIWGLPGATPPDSFNVYWQSFT